MWSRSDLSWLADNYPALSETSTGIIEGALTFSMLRSNGQYIVRPTASLIDDTSPADYLFITDTYEIKISWPAGAQYPRADETGSKLADTARRLNKHILDMHQYEQGGALCLATDMALERNFRDGFKLDVFVEELLIPYLFAQSHFAETEVWLWGELSHGFIGILEWLSRLEDPTPDDIASTIKSLNKHLGVECVQNLQAIRWRPHFKCLCKSGAKTRDCHPEILNGLRILRSSNNWHPQTQ